MKSIVRRIATSRAPWIAAALLLVYGLVGYFVVPYLIERSVPRYAENLGAHAAIGKVRLNPFLLKLEANDFRLDAAAGRPLVAFNRLFADLELVSLLRWTWTFADVQLDGLQVNAEIGRDGRFNLAELAERWSEGKPREPGRKPPRIIVRHLALRAATFTFTDFSQPNTASAQSDAIDLDVAELATIPDREGRYAISAKLPGGGALSWQGELSLQPIASKGEWRISGLKLATVWQFFRDELNVAEPGGIMNLAGRYDFSYDGAAALALQGVHAQVSALSIAHEGDQRSLLALDTIEATDAHYDLAKHELIVPRLKLANGTLEAVRSANGELNWQSAFTETPRARNVRKKRASSPLHVRAEAVAIEDVGLRYTDNTRATPLDYAAFLHADFGLDITRGEETTQVTGERVRLTLTDAKLKVAKSGDALADLKSIVLDGGRFDTTARTVVIDTLAIKGGRTALMRAANETITLLDAFSPAHSSNERAAIQDKGSTQRWKYVVHAADVSGLGVALSDRGYQPAVRYDIEVAAALKNIAGDAKSPIELKAALRVAQGGTINCSGTLAQDFMQASIKVDAVGVGAEPLRPVLARYTSLDLKSGNASAVARLDYRNGGKPVWRVQGSATILNFLVNEAATGDRLLSWKTLSADNIALTVSPDRVTVKEIRIVEPGAKIVVAKDRSVNISQVLKPRGDSRASAPPRKPQSDRFQVNVARIGLRQGTLDFADNSLVLPFSTRVKSLNGAIVGLSSSPQSRAELKLDGLIDPNGSASAVGSLKPADPRSFLDIDVKFDNVEMAPLSPYTATFAGRKVAAGRLSLDVQYKIVDSQLLGENKIVMADFQLGERVQAPNALDLPLDLAVALLKEPDGRIRFAVPVRGDVGNPQFDYGALIRDVIAKALMRIVTAPFRFIAELLGGRGDEDLESVNFPPGSAQLMPPVREQLQKVTRALKERPQVKLVVHGAYDPERDVRALRDVEVRRAVAQALGVKLQRGEDPGPIAYDDSDTQRTLEKLLSARAGGDAVDRFAVEYTKKTGKEARRVNPLLAVFGRGGGDRVFYEALFDRLVQIEPLPDTVLADLAAHRARAIADFIAQSGIDPERIGVGKAQIVEDRSKPLAAKLALEAV
ncbi:MAG TPA: DUF748 domain-containing protein [Casimicrobiaceae bacterium]|nr:DUF748 domain-containing protein [Casimicrobiaceae bacterium]